MTIKTNLDELTDTLNHQPDRRRLSRRALAVGIGLVMITIAFALLSAWHLRTMVIRDAESDTQALGTVLAEQTKRLVQVYDLIHRGLEARFRTQNVRSLTEQENDWGSEETHNLLRQYLDFLPAGGSIGLIDAQGILVNSSRFWPPPHIDVSAREHYRFHKEISSDTLHIMLRRRPDAGGDPVIYLSRRISAADGSFMGILAGALDVPELAKFYKTLNVYEARTITLLRSDGLILAAYPRHDDLIGTKVPAQSDWRDINVTAGGEVYHGTHFLTGKPVIASIHPVPGLPLVIDVSRATDDVLAIWRHQINLIVAGQIIVITATILFLGLMLRQFRMQDEQLAILKEVGEAAVQNARRISDFAAMASDWFWEQDRNLRFVPIETRAPSTRSVDDQSSYGKTRREQSGVDPGNMLWDQHERDLNERRPFRDFRYQKMGHDGRIHHLSVSGNPIFDADGTFKGYRGVGRDITADMEAADALRLAKERAESAVVARAEFLANMSHELRTPLNVIIGFADLIARHPTVTASPPIVNYARDIHTSGQDLLAMINAILDLSKLEDGLYQLRGDHVRVGPIMRTCITEARREAEAKGIKVEYQDPGFTAVLYCDGHAVRQIIQHILSNAVKFTPANGLVSAGLERAPNGGLVIRVIDTGIGIEPDVLKRLFEPFYQANASLTRAHGGTGLGLAISCKLMALHGGSIEVESVPDQGTVVRLIFPPERVLSPSPTAP